MQNPFAKMRFLAYRDEDLSNTFTGIIHRGHIIIGVDVMWTPQEDRAIGIMLGSLWIGWCYRD